MARWRHSPCSICPGICWRAALSTVGPDLAVTGAAILHFNGTTASAAYVLFGP